MASKVHCDVCDNVGASQDHQAVVPVPGQHHWDKNRLMVKVEVWGVRQENARGNPEPFGQKDVCDDCRRKLVADAFGLRTPDDYNALRDELNEVIKTCREELAAARGQEPEAVPAEPTVPAEPDNDIPF